MIIRYSMLDSYLQCPQKFNLQYLQEGAIKQESNALAFGSALHLAIKTHFEGEDPYATFDMYWNTIKGKHLEYDRYSWDDLGEMARDTFLPNFIRLHAKRFSDVKMEETLEMPILPYEACPEDCQSKLPPGWASICRHILETRYHTLQGTFDCCAMVDGKLTMIDYKTSAREYPQAKIHRNPQLYIYAALYQHKYGVLPEQIMYKVFIKQERRIQTLKLPLTLEKQSHMMKNVEAICRDMIQRIENKAWYCNYNSCYCGTPQECFK